MLSGLKGPSRRNKKWRIMNQEKVKQYTKNYNAYYYKLNREKEKRRVRNYRATINSHDLYVKQLRYKNRYYSNSDNKIRLREYKKMWAREYRRKQKQLKEILIVDTIKTT